MEERRRGRGLRREVGDCVLCGVLRGWSVGGVWVRGAEVWCVRGMCSASGMCVVVVRSGGWRPSE